MDTNRRSTAAGFEGKNFYFDLENSPQISLQLTKYITELGGEIKSFLDQRVKYIITNRPKDQWPPKLDTNDKSRPSTSALEPLKDQTIQSPINLNKSFSFSRGKLLLTAIAKNQQTIQKPSLPTDVLERGRFWNITILRAVDVLAFCRRHLSPDVADKSTASPAEIKRLKGAFIKIEDNRQQHRPTYKEFIEWPQINFEGQDISCPFLKGRVIKRVIEDSTAHETVESLEGLAIKNRLINESLNKTNDKNIKTNSNVNKTKLKSNHNIVSMRKELAKKRRVPAFCEICGTEYDDLFEHLKCETHQTFTKNEENYTALKGVIQSLQPFNETQITVKRIQFDDRSDDSSNDSDDSNDGTEQPISNPVFQSTPKMSTIQLCGSKHKSHFLSIHDLISNNQSRQPVPEGEQVPQKPDSGDIDDNRSSKTDIELIPPSVSSPDTQAVQKCNQILNVCSNNTVIYNSDNSLDDSRTELNPISVEL